MPATGRDHQRLLGVHPILVGKILAILEALPMFVVVGLRTATQQAQLYAEGRTTPGPIVTNDDGTMHRSNHEAHSDGWGHAVDCAWVPTLELPSPFDQRFPWGQYGALVEAAGLTWGGTWRMVDMPHAELA